MEDTSSESVVFESGVPNVVSFDEYGFAVFAPGYEPEAERCHDYVRLQEDGQLLTQWGKVMSQPDWRSMHGCPSIKVQKLIRQGVPATVRPALWTKLLDADTLSASSSFNYQAQLRGVREQLVDLGVSEYGGPEVVSYLYEMETSGSSPPNGHVTFDCLRQILLDLDRSYPTHEMFMTGHQAGIEGRAALFRILATYARYNKEVAYCQGMSYLGGLLLMVMHDEEKAFWGLVSLLERFKYLRGYYDKHMERIQRHVMVFTKLVKHRVPHIATHMEEQGVQPLMFSTPLFLSLFTSLPCWETVLAIWDLFMLDGAVTIFRVGLGLLDAMEDLILSSRDMSNLLPQLLHPPHDRVAFLHLMPAVYDVYLEDWEVAQLEAVVMEETGVSTANTAARRRPLSDQPATKRRRIDNDVPASVASARNSGGTGSGQSFFRRFVNIFTPRDQRRKAGSGASSERTTSSGRRAAAQRRLHQGARAGGSGVRTSYGQVYVAGEPSTASRSNGQSHLETNRESPVASTLRRKVPKKRLTLHDENEDMHPQRRRSPRIRQRALRDVNTASTRRIVGSAAEVQYSFKEFSAPKPLRKTQRKAEQASRKENSATGASLVASPVELKTLMCKTQ